MWKENLYDKLQIKCHNEAFDCFGYQFIFDRRGSYYNFLFNALATFGVLIPVL